MKMKKIVFAIALCWASFAQAADLDRKLNYSTITWSATMDHAGDFQLRAGTPSINTNFEIKSGSIIKVINIVPSGTVDGYDISQQFTDIAISTNTFAKKTGDTITGDFDFITEHGIRLFSTYGGYVSVHNFAGGDDRNSLKFQSYSSGNPEYDSVQFVNLIVAVDTITSYGNTLFINSTTTLRGNLIIEGNITGGTTQFIDIDCRQSTGTIQNQINDIAISTGILRDETTGYALLEYVNIQDNAIKTSTGTLVKKSGDTMTGNLLVGASIQANIFRLSDTLGSKLVLNPWGSVSNYIYGDYGEGGASKIVFQGDDTSAMKITGWPLIVTTVTACETVAWANEPIGLTANYMYVLSTPVVRGNLSVEGSILNSDYFQVKADTGTLNLNKLDSSSATVTYMPLMGEPIFSGSSLNIGSGKINFNSGREGTVGQYMTGRSIAFGDTGDYGGTVRQDTDGYLRIQAKTAKKILLCGIGGDYIENQSSYTFTSGQQLYTDSPANTVLTSSFAVNGNLTVEGKLTGDGSGLTNISGTGIDSDCRISTGTLHDYIIGNSTMMFSIQDILTALDSEVSADTNTLHGYVIGLSTDVKNIRDTYSTISTITYMTDLSTITYIVSLATVTYIRDLSTITYVVDLSTLDYVNTGSFNLLAASTGSLRDEIIVSTGEIQTQINNVAVSTGNMITTDTYQLISATKTFAYSGVASKSYYFGFTANDEVPNTHTVFMYNDANTYGSEGNFLVTEATSVIKGNLTVNGLINGGYFPSTVTYMRDLSTITYIVDFSTLDYVNITNFNTLSVSTGTLRNETTGYALLEVVNNKFTTYVDTFTNRQQIASDKMFREMLPSGCSSYSLIFDGGGGWIWSLHQECEAGDGRFHIGNRDAGDHCTSIVLDSSTTVNGYFKVYGPLTVYDDVISPNISALAISTGSLRNEVIVSTGEIQAQINDIALSTGNMVTMDTYQSILASKTFNTDSGIEIKNSGDGRYNAIVIDAGGQISRIYTETGSTNLHFATTQYIEGNLTVNGLINGGYFPSTATATGDGGGAAPSVILSWTIDGQIFTTTNTYTKGGFEAQVASTKTVELSNLYMTIDTPAAYEWGIRITTGAIASGVMSWGTFTEQTVPVSISSYTWTVDKNIPANTPCKLNIISVPNGCTVGDVSLWGTNE